MKQISILFLILHVFNPQSYAQKKDLKEVITNGGIVQFVNSLASCPGVDDSHPLSFFNVNRYLPEKDNIYRLFGANVLNIYGY